MAPDMVFTAGAAAIGVVVWLIRLEGRVNTQAALHDRLSEDVSYIRERIDAALNGRK
jgi:sensor domain CHASE-containing protein